MEASGEYVFFFEVADGYSFRNMVEHLKATNVEGHFRFSEEGITYQQSDAQNILLNEIELRKEDLQKYIYTLTESIIVGLVLADLQTITKKITKKDGFRMYRPLVADEEENHMIYCQIISQSKSQRSNVYFLRDSEFDPCNYGTIPYTRKLNDHTWKISDRDKETGLVMVGITVSDPHLQKYNAMVLDVLNERIVCEPINALSYDCVGTSVPLDKDGVNLKCLIDQNTSVTLPLSEVSFYPGHEGAILRVFYHNDQTWYSTYRRLDASSSRWGPSKTFLELYEELGGKDPYTNGAPKTAVFYFLLLHRELQSVSQDEIGENGQLILLRTAGECGDFDAIKAFDLQVESPLTLEQANALLQGANHPDPRLSGADFIMVIHPTMTVKIVTPAYRWRTAVRRDNSNLHHLIYSSLTDANQDGRFGVSSKDYLEKYIPFKPLPLSVIEVFHKNKLPLGIAVGTKEEVLANRGNREHNIFMNLFLTVSPAGRQTVIDCYKNFEHDRNELVAWISDDKFELSSVTDEVCRKFYEHASKRIEQIVKEVNNRLQLNRGYLTNYFSFHLKKILLNENGVSLYRLIKLMKDKKNNRMPVLNRPGTPVTQD